MKNLKVTNLRDAISNIQRYNLLDVDGDVLKIEVKEGMLLPSMKFDRQLVTLKNNKKGTKDSGVIEASAGENGTYVVGDYRYGSVPGARFPTFAKALAEAKTATVKYLTYINQTNQKQAGKFVDKNKSSLPF